MPIVRKIRLDSTRLGIKPTEELVYDANNVQDISSFNDRQNPSSANSLRVLYNFVRSAVVPTTALIFDDVPTEGSVNPVTSDGIKRYIDNTLSSMFLVWVRDTFVVLTQAEYDEILVPDPNKFYFIIDEEEPEPEPEPGV